MAKGDHVYVWRSGYQHHGIDLGDGRVCHYSGLADGLRAGPVEVVSLSSFSKRAPVHVLDHAERPYSASEVCQRALSRVGEDSYDVFANNCQHFASWCVQGDAHSKQVDRGVAVVNKVQALGSAAGAVAMVSSAGTVAGLSGPGIASGLAAVGPGGMVGGVATLTGGAGLGAATLLNNTLFKDNEALDAHERGARQAARVGTYAGAGAVAVGGIGAIGAAGSVAGFSGAGIMSGLGAIGTASGAATAGLGAAVGGTAVVVAAPVVAAAAVGGVVYGLWKWLGD